MKLHAEYFLGPEQEALPLFPANRWESEKKTLRQNAGAFAKVYPLYWKNELVLTKGKSRLEREQESLKLL